MNVHRHDPDCAQKNQANMSPINSMTIEHHFLRQSTRAHTHTHALFHADPSTHPSLASTIDIFV